MTATDEHDHRDGPRVTFHLLPGGRGWRVSYGDDQRGRYVIVDDFQIIRPFVNGERPLSDLVDLYFV